ncbi:hypothetical protein [Alteriqipengyuania sp.]|uniref:hypothetical protein n=1 Tax=Alteriqipengyuania sp. TaxID=2800692 RepID=UPI00351951B9
MSKKRINPFDRGTAEHVLFDRWRRAMLAAKAAGEARDQAAVEHDAYEAKAGEYAKALRALGHGEHLPGGAQAQLPAPSGNSE